LRLLETKDKALESGCFQKDYGGPLHIFEIDFVEIFGIKSVRSNVNTNLLSF